MQANFMNEQEYYQTMIQKLVLFEQQNSSFTQQIKIQFYYNPVTRQINLTRSLNQFFSTQNAAIQNSQIFYYHENYKYYIYVGTFPFQKDFFLKYEQVQEEYIKIKCRQLYYDQPQQQVCHLGIDQSKIVNSKKRAKERTIKQVLEKVAEWRCYYETKKYNLQTAAKFMQMSKKTLDDYYMQVKLAQNYGFDFELNKNLGIGFLRKFVKEKHQKKKSNPKILEKYMNNMEQSNHIDEKKKSLNMNDIDEYFLNDQGYDEEQQEEQ